VIRAWSNDTGSYSQGASIKNVIDPPAGGFSWISSVTVKNADMATHINSYSFSPSDWILMNLIFYCLAVGNRKILSVI
jgi:hypothetical protein